MKQHVEEEVRKTCTDIEATKRNLCFACLAVLKLTLLGFCVHSKRSRLGHRSSLKPADAKMKREGRKRLQDEKDGKTVVVLMNRKKTTNVKRDMLKRKYP